jgi:hypothetical protein
MATLPAMPPAKSFWERMREVEQKARPPTVRYAPYILAVLSGVSGYIWMNGEQHVNGVYYYCV